MRPIGRTLALLLCCLAVALAAAPAGAHDLGPVGRKGRDLPEVRRLVELHDELHQLLARYRRLEAGAGRAWLDTVAVIRDAEAARQRAEEAKRRLEDRVRTAYQLGAGGRIEALLGASSFSELALISEYAERTFAIDDATLRDALVAEAVLTARRGLAQASQAALAPRLERLRSLLRVMQEKVDEAVEIAERAQVEAEIQAEIEAQRRAVAAAVLRAGSWDLGVIDYGQDQSHLLALLGPTGGRTCETPQGLVETGEAFQGYASWYGWEFGGQPTATGAIYDPRLFTVANRWLPFGTFLRVRHADRCAIVLVNDRGPYGRLERVLDLSQASAEYLGVGVSWVSAEILVPAEGLPT
jgi:rare lipoprotein A (peptidoglycan hydrolase)